MSNAAITERLLMPKVELSSLLFAAIVRDTRGVNLPEAERYNCFPSSPLCAVTRVFEGQVFEVDEDGSIANTPLPELTLTGPYHLPKVSWNPGPVHALSIGFYPDAWHRLTGMNVANLIDKTIAFVPDLSQEVFDCFGTDQNVENDEKWFDQLQGSLAPLWVNQRQTSQTGAMLKDWALSVIGRAFLSGRGRSLRQAQRRIKALTGQTQRELHRHIRMETLFAKSRHIKEDATLAGLSADLNFADQSHMGREVRRITGNSPQRINHLIQSDERYWCYRLLGERF